jgi:LacI family transcriptional regulator
MSLLPPKKRPGRLTIGTFFAMHAPLAHQLQLGVTQFATEHRGIELRRWDFRQWPRPKVFPTLGLDGVVAQMFTHRKRVSWRSCPVPIVNVSFQNRFCDLPRISPDETAIGEAVADYFLRRGYQYFAYCGHPWHGGSHLRHTGFSSVIEKAGFRVANFDLVPHPDEVSAFTYVREHRRIRRWLRSRETPCAIMAFNDDVAVFVIRNALDLGLRVPQDIAVMGVDNVPYRTNETPVSISSVDVDFVKVGYLATAALVKHLEDPTAPIPDTVTRAFAIISRRSTDAWAAEDTLVRAALECIDRNRTERLRVDHIARTVGVSRRVLERRFRAELGTSVYDLLQESRLVVAKNLLRSSAMPLKEIAAAGGFRSAQHLSVVFRAKLNTTPTEFRDRSSPTPWHLVGSLKTFSRPT